MTQQTNHKEIKYRFWNTDYTMQPMMEIGDTGDLKFVERSIGKHKMLFAGRQDKNRKDLFEEDIVQINDLLGSEKIGYIKYRDGCFRLSKQVNSKNAWDGEIRMWNDGDHDWYSIENLETFETEIIGNIHQNPELLNQ